MRHLYVSAKAKIILARVLAGAALICWLSFIELYIYFSHTKPHTLDTAVGRVITLNNHGSIAYLTRDEDFILYAFAWVAASLFAVAVLLNRTAKAGSRRS